MNSMTAFRFFHLYRHPRCNKYKFHNTKIMVLILLFKQISVTLNMKVYKSKRKFDFSLNNLILTFSSINFTKLINTHHLPSRRGKSFFTFSGGKYSFAFCEEKYHWRWIDGNHRSDTSRQALSFFFCRLVKLLLKVGSESFAYRPWHRSGIQTNVCDWLGSNVEPWNRSRPINAPSVINSLSNEEKVEWYVGC